MKILLTGASSFTGAWFAESLADAGHTVLAPLRGGLDSGDDAERAARLERLSGRVALTPDAPMGSERFMALLEEQPDVFCHHAAEVGDYRNPDFDIPGALDANTRNLRQAVVRLAERGAKGLVLTGSFFEHGEGAGDPPHAAFSPYGLSKGLTAQVVQHRCHEVGLAYGKFVIPHPFGPREQPRLGAYLARTWAAGDAPEIKTPDYVRDNIPVDLLALCYRRFVAETEGAAPVRKLNPSGYVERQGAFVQRMAREIGARLGRTLPVRFADQTAFPEPRMRVNTDPAAAYAPDWDEARFWDAYAQQFD